MLPSRGKTVSLVVISIVLLLAMLGGPSNAIDRGYLKKVPANLKDKVFDSFAQVPVYYLVTSEGNSLVQKYDKLLPSFRAPMGYVVVLYLEPSVAEAYRQRAEKQDRRQYVVRSARLDTILRVQYAAIDRPPSEDSDKPDFVVLQNLAGVPVAPEFLAYADDVKKPYIGESRGRRSIPAFIFQKDALKFQEALTKKTGKKFTRVGQDFASFLDFVSRYATSDSPVVVFGYQQE